MQSPFMKGQYNLNTDYFGSLPFKLGNFARESLLNALNLLNIRSGDKIALPSLICKDLLAPINILNLKIIYYDVDHRLQPIGLETLEPASLILAINYFGFPQDMASFHFYCKKHGAVVIEDNAHGFLSVDENKCPLGFRGDIGIFSFRKVVPVRNGSAFVVNNPNLLERHNITTDQMPIGVFPLTYQKRNVMRIFSPLLGNQHILLSSKLVRMLRKIRSGNPMITSSPDSEYKIPVSDDKNLTFLHDLSTLDPNFEVTRRRELYHRAEQALASSPIEPIYQSLPQNTSPLGYPFYCSKNNIEKVVSRLKRASLECHTWPDLPQSFRDSAPSFYQDLHLVRFKW